MLSAVPLRWPHCPPSPLPGRSAPIWTHLHAHFLCTRIQRLGRYARVKGSDISTKHAPHFSQNHQQPTHARALTHTALPGLHAMHRIMLLGFAGSRHQSNSPRRSVWISAKTSPLRHSTRQPLSSSQEAIHTAHPIKHFQTTLPESRNLFRLRKLM